MDSRTDKQKLEDFTKSLAQITGPELKEKNSLDILDNALELIKCAREFIIEELNKANASVIN